MINSRNLTNTSLLSRVPGPGKVDIQVIRGHIWGRRQALYSAGLVRQILCNLNVQKATGADGISARLLKMPVPAIANSLTHLFNCSMEIGSLAEGMEGTPCNTVHKQGDKENVGNYI